MKQKRAKFPAFEVSNEKLLSERALVSLDMEQILDICNVFHHFLNRIVNRPFSGVKVSEARRIALESVYQCVINCALSLEEAAKVQNPEKD